MITTLFNAFAVDFPVLSYYGVPIIPEGLFPYNGDPDHVRRCCEEFIRDHFIRGRKESAFDFDFFEMYQKQGKHEHTVSLYLMGLLMRDMFFPQIKTDLCKLGINASGWYTDHDFMYTWYLTCLYHDVASCVEKIDRQQLPCCKNCILKMKTPYSHKPNFAKKRISRFSRRSVKNYCYYRMSSGMQDHGIYGGILLFDSLERNFKRNTRRHSWEKEPTLLHDELLWRLEHLDHFAYIADAIICHNMWTAKAGSEQAEEYRKAGLNELIISNESQKLRMSEYPLQFMLCLLDTIEPTKRFGRMTAREVLDNISVERIAGGEIRIAWTDLIKRQPEFWTWMGNISGMKDWMQVDVSPCRKEEDWCYIIISIQ